MKLTSQTDYAIRILLFCHAKGDRANVKEIANFYGLSLRFLFNIVLKLSEAGHVKTVRGRGGGVFLTRPADEIRLGDVVRDVEDNFDLAECFSETGTDCPLNNACGVNQALSRALATFFESLNETSIADLTHESHNINVLMRLNKAMAVPFQAGRA